MEIQWMKKPEPFKVPKGLRRIIFCFKLMIPVYIFAFLRNVYMGDWWAMVNYVMGSACVLVVWHHYHVYVPGMVEIREEYNKTIMEMRTEMEKYMEKTNSQN